MRLASHRQKYGLLAILAACFLLTVIPGCFAQPAAGSQETGAPLKVGIYLDPPFVMKSGTGYSGMAIDLWQESAAKLGLNYQYVEMQTVPDLLQAVSAGQVDFAVGNITITQERMQRMDFTQPWFNSGLRVMIDQDRQDRFGAVMKGLYQSGHLRVLKWLGIIILAAVIALTVIDRRYDEHFPKKWSEGLVESLYHVLSVVTSGKSSHKLLFGVYGRLVASFWLICGIAVVAYVTSSVTAVMTVASLNDQIHSSADLHGHPVGAIAGTVGEAWCLDAGLATQSFANLPAAVHALLRRQIVAIVSDAPSLEYYDTSHPELPITEVGAIFLPQTYGFATPIGSTQNRAVSVQIVSDMEDGTLSKIHAKYFGVEP